MKLSDVADELYGLPPDEFIGAREARRKEARADGDRDLARAVGKLRKPSTAAWVVNTVTRREATEMAQLVDLGAALREAQETLEGDELKDLAQQRHRVVAALTRQARSLAQELGRPVSDSVAEQVQDTLRAAIADEDAGQAVLSGHLLTALSHSGMAHVEVEGAVADVGSRERKPAAARNGASRSARSSADPRRRRAREEALEKARADLVEAEAAAAEADDEAAADRERVEQVGARRDDARARIDDLEQQLRRAEKEAGALGEEFRTAQRRRDVSERRSGRARTVHDRARARVERLSAEVSRGCGED
ncbi:hypothetical protein [Blastococcus capsensis]|uniref:hypothetical protein n=1 Tax=Blastococcus capsensis TaxID=1564163 RepID=UPI0025402EAE|nr:hypothetical protein [Blastococcus capsensis]MDK3255781.1 hypothetical protein [Blastococcus capsensis]